MEKKDLTFPQKNIYMVDILNGNNALNTIAGILKINENFDTNICSDIINELIKRNDALRLNILKEKQPKQIVSNYEKIDIEVIDMIGKSSEEVKIKLDELTSMKIDIYSRQLIYFYIIKTNKNVGIIYLKMHHIIGDAWTLMQIINQLTEMYENKLNGEDITINPPSYLEFIESEKEYENSEKYQKDKEFWQEYLNEISDPVSLKDRNKKISNIAKRYTAVLSQDENDKINEYCKLNRVSPYTLFISALATYIYRIKDVNDIVIGTPILNRSNFREKKMLGCFISTIPMRIKIEEGIKFLDLVKSVTAQTMTLFRHQKYPITKTLENIHNTTDNKGKIYNIMLSYQNARADVPHNMSTEWIFSRAIQDDLEIHVMDMDSTGLLRINYDYLSELFENIEIEYLHTRLMEIIKDTIKNADVTIEDIRIMSKEEENKILYEFNDTASDYPKDKTVIDLFEEQVKKTPDSIALVFEDKKMTYRELNERANSLAYYLKVQKNIRQWDVVAIAMEKSFEFYIVILAILKADAIYLPIDLNIPKERKKYIIENSNAKLVIVDNNENETNICNYSDIDLSGHFEDFEHVSKYDDIAYIMYTSGSTGNPKGAMMFNYNVVKLVKNITYFDMSKVKNIFLAGSVGFDASMHEMWLCFLNGKTGHIITKNIMLEPNKYEKLLLKYEDSIAIFTTQLFHQYVNYNPNIFKNVRYLVAGGDIMLSKYANKAKKLLPNTNVINIYGPTECSAASTTYDVKGNEEIIPIGRPINNTKCYIMDKKSRLLPIGIEGELYVLGDGVGNGYINNKIATEKNFIYIENSSNRVYKTGDISKYIFDGNIIFIGRNDFQLKINGYRIEISEIQNVVLKFQNIKETYIRVSQKGIDKEMSMYVTASKKIDIPRLKKYLSERLPKYMIPNKIMQIEFLPLNSNGKVDSKLLPDISLKSIKDKKLDIILTNTEKKVKNSFEEILNLDEIDIDEDLFDLGLDSLKVATAIIKFSNMKINNVGYQDVFDLRTIRNISSFIDYRKNNFERESKYFSNYDYTKINKLLLNNDINVDVKNIAKHKKIILTGTTGYLGCHLLMEFLEKTKAIVYCPIRNKTINARDRLMQKIEAYFSKEKCIEFNSRIKVIQVDFENELDMENLEKIIQDEKITLMINCAANVKHYGDKELSYIINVKLVEDLLDICKKNNMKFIQISTLSVCGNSFEGEFEKQNITEKIKFTERDIYIGQKIKNVYTYSKYVAEVKVLEAILSGVNASIIRIGNLTTSKYTGKFQLNIEDNGFVQRIRFLIDNKKISQSLYNNVYLEFSSVDKVAEAIFLISRLKKGNSVYHLYNYNHINLSEFVNYYNNESKDKISVIDDKSFKYYIEEMLKNNDIVKYSVLLEDFKLSNDIKYDTNIVVEEKITNEILKKMGFEWPVMTSKYIGIFIKSIGGIIND